ncbi:MAG: hypothetical protein WCJ21_09855 [Planctomycetota bacterium]
MRSNALTLFRYVLAATVIAGGVSYAVDGQRWYWVLGPVVVGLALLLGFGRLFGVGITRTPNDVVCRYVPWFEGNSFFTIVLLPLLGLAFVAMANGGESLRRLSPGVMRFLGVALLSLGLLFLWAALRQWRRCRLDIGRSALTVGVIKPGSTPIVIRRGEVEAISTHAVTPGNQTILKATQVAIAFRGTSPGTATETIQIGPMRDSEEAGLQLSVKPENLARALVDWKDGSADDPKLLDRVEALLRGR